MEGVVVGIGVEVVVEDRVVVVAVVSVVVVEVVVVVVVGSDLPYPRDEPNSLLRYFGPSLG